MVIIHCTAVLYDFLLNSNLRSSNQIHQTRHRFVWQLKSDTLSFTDATSKQKPPLVLFIVIELVCFGPCLGVALFTRDFLVGSDLLSLGRTRNALLVVIHLKQLHLEQQFKKASDILSNAIRRQPVRYWIEADRVLDQISKDLSASIVRSAGVDCLHSKN